MRNHRHEGTEIQNRSHDDFPSIRTTDGEPPFLPLGQALFDLRPHLPLGSKPASFLTAALSPDVSEELRRMCPDMLRLSLWYERPYVDLAFGCSFLSVVPPLARYNARRSALMVHPEQALTWNVSRAIRDAEKGTQIRYFRIC